MRLAPERDLVLVSTRSGENDNGPWAMVRLADPETYENITFSLDREQDVNTLVDRNRYRVVIEASPGKNGNYYAATLTPTETKKTT